MIVWSGWGILTPLIILVTSGFVTKALQALAIPKGVDLAVGLIVGGVINYIIGRALNAPVHDRNLVDPKTGQVVILRRSNTFFFLPMQIWSYIAWAFAIFIGGGVIIKLFNS